MTRKTPNEQFEISEQFKVGPELVLIGRKLAPPARRIVLAQDGLQVVAATITWQDKNGNKSATINRINHLPTKNEVRLHTDEVLFPREYEVRLKLKS